MQWSASSGKIFVILGVAFCFVCQPLLHAASELDVIRQKFIGDYELVSYVTYPAQGEANDMDYIGRLSYDAYGNMTGIGMPRNLPERAAQSSEQMTSGFAYWGTVSFDLDQGVVIHHVEGSPMRGGWVGQDNIRYFEFTDEFLKLSLKSASGRTTATLTWRRLE
ncbi:MAG: lipocalin-like domain-containing protein [Proteobacteria bacterium]|nr:lipocalin-like domain-containing protein [Pseudomonadota bacterium]